MKKFKRNIGSIKLILAVFKFICSVFAISAVLLVYSGTTSAALIVVNAQFGESGCDLRDAIDSANQNASISGCVAGDPDNVAEDQIVISLAEVDFQNVVRTFNSEYGWSGLPHITSKIVMFGFPSLATLTREASYPSFRFFVVRGGGELTLNNISLQGGSVGGSGTLKRTSGGAIFIDCGAKVRINGGELARNRARSGGGAIAINSFVACDTVSTLSISRSLLNDNTVDGYGGAIISSLKTSISITDSTISGNQAANSGGAIACRTSHMEAYAGCNLDIVNATIAVNLAHEGGGIFINGQSGGEGNRMTMRNSIVSGNISGAEGKNNIFVRFYENQPISLHNNVIGSNEILANRSTNLPASILQNNIIMTSDGADSAPLNQIIGFLQDNGGQFMSHELTPNSPALNKGIEVEYGGAPLFQIRGRGCRDVRFFPLPSGLLNFRDDQNGTKRPIGAACDIGAVESRYGEDEMCYAIPTKNAKTVVFCL